TPPTPIYTLSLHDALPISAGETQKDGGGGDRGLPEIGRRAARRGGPGSRGGGGSLDLAPAQSLRVREHPARSPPGALAADPRDRSEEHTSELQSLAYLVCR